MSARTHPVTPATGNIPARGNIPAHGNAPAPGNARRRGARRQVAGRAASVVLLLVLTAALFGPLVSPYDPLEQRADERLLRPSVAHPFGTDGFGRDVLTRVIYATRVSLAVALCAVAAATAAGALLGAAAAYSGGVFDLVLGRLVDLLLGFPSIVLAIVVIVTMSPSPTAIGIAIASALFPQVARVSRAASLTVVSEPYVTAAVSLGLGRFRIALRHLLPNVLSPLLAQASGLLGTAIVAEATLSYLGLGVPPPYPSLGRMLLEGSRQYFESAPWVTLFPGVVIAICVVSFALLADALRDRLDPSR